MAISTQLLIDEISPSLKKLANDSIAEEAMEVAAEAMAALGQRAFDEPGLRPDDWPPLSKKHQAKRFKKAKRKTRKGKKPTVQLLVDSGTLLQGVQAQGNEFGASAPYAAAHQFGFEDNNLPARPFLPLTSDGESLTDGANQEVMDIIAETIEALSE